MTRRWNEGRWRGAPATSTMTSAAQVPSSGGLGVELPCTLAKRSRLLPDVFDDSSYVGRRLSPRDRAIIREVNETVFTLNFLKTAGIGCSESCEKVEYSILSVDPAPPSLRRLYSVIADFRPTSVSGERALRKLLASPVIGGHPLTSQDRSPCSNHRELLDHRMREMLFTLGLC